MKDKYKYLEFVPDHEFCIVLEFKIPIIVKEFDTIITNIGFYRTESIFSNQYYNNDIMMIVPDIIQIDSMIYNIHLYIYDLNVNFLRTIEFDKLQTFINRKLINITLTDLPDFDLIYRKSFYNYCK